MFKRVGAPAVLLFSSFAQVTLDGVPQSAPGVLMNVGKSLYECRLSERASDGADLDGMLQALNVHRRHALVGSPAFVDVGNGLLQALTLLQFVLTLLDALHPVLDSQRRVFDFCVCHFAVMFRCP